jgi:hypothetical protein
MSLQMDWKAESTREGVREADLNRIIKWVDWRRVRRILVIWLKEIRLLLNTSYLFSVSILISPYSLSLFLSYPLFRISITLTKLSNKSLNISSNFGFISFVSSELSAEVISLNFGTKPISHPAGEMAEWSKAPALGAGPKGRGFEPHSHHIF